MTDGVIAVTSPGDVLWSAVPSGRNVKSETNLHYSVEYARYLQGRNMIERRSECALYPLQIDNIYKLLEKRTLWTYLYTPRSLERGSQLKKIRYIRKWFVDTISVLGPCLCTLLRNKWLVLPVKLRGTSQRTSECQLMERLNEQSQFQSQQTSSGNLRRNNTFVSCNAENLLAHPPHQKG